MLAPLILELAGCCALSDMVTATTDMTRQRGKAKFLFKGDPPLQEYVSRGLRLGTDSSASPAEHASSHFSSCEYKTTTERGPAT